MCLCVKKCQNETRVVYHYWYTAWPDHNLPEQPDSLIKLIKQVENMNKYDENSELMDEALDTRCKKGGPILVHCSAGVGRTGCFLALSVGIRQLDAESLVDVVQIVCSLRRDRLVNFLTKNKFKKRNYFLKLNSFTIIMRIKQLTFQYWNYLT